MPTNVIGTYDTAEMLEAINATPRPRTFLLERCFGGNVRTFDTKYVLLDWRRGGRVMAPFVNRKIGGKLVEKLSTATRRYEPPMIAPRAVFRGDEAFERGPGEVIGGDASPAERMAALIADEFASHDMLITRRIEWMVAKMLTTGTIPIVGEGVVDEIDLDFTQTEALGGADLWTASTSDPLGDIEDWSMELIQAAGVTPDTAILGKTAAKAFKSHEKVQNYLNLRNVMPGQMNPRELPNGVKYIGSIEAVDYFTYPEWYIDDTTGVETPMIPDAACVLFPSSARNIGAKMLYGAHWEAKSRTAVKGERIPRQWVEEGPNVEFAELVSYPVPLMPDVDSWKVATVV